MAETSTSRLVIKNTVTNRYYSLAEKTLISIPNISIETLSLYGMRVSQEINLNEEFNKIQTITVNNNEYSDSLETVSPFSVYDYIGELPEIIVYTELTDDIIVSTKTENYSVYDEFNQEIEVLYYTDDNSVNNTNLILEANWSPIDELEGDSEVVTLTSDNMQPSLELNAIPKPQFVYKSNLNDIRELKDVIISDMSNYYTFNSPVKLLFSQNNVDWYYFNGINFTKLTSLTMDNIKKYGNTVVALNALNNSQFNTWSFDKINVGIYLEDDARNTLISKSSDIEIINYLPNNTSIVEDTSFYILNTTARIDIDLQGNSIFGSLSDADMTRVQYRVKLNGQPYFPSDGEFTTLAPSPQSISINFTSDDIKIDDWNDVEVEFQDFFGTTDTWSTRFVGKYAGILFSDENGELYSTDVGKVLKYLDFGTVLTGQSTPIYTVKLKNEYGFNVKDVTVQANTSEFAEGLELDLSLDSTVSDFSEILTIPNMANNDEISFYLRMRSPITTVPNGQNSFDIFVSAKRDV